MAVRRPLLVVEDDVWTRLIGVVLDPATARERHEAFADFMAPDVPDFAGWCDRVRKAAPALYPSEVKFVDSAAELQRNLADADALVVESLAVRAADLAPATRLKVVQKYGAVLRNIDVAGCKARGVAVLGVRRRANIACAEHAFGLVLALARQLGALSGIVSVDQLPPERRPYRAFDRRHTPNANWGRFPGMRSLHGSTLGIIGLGEIGREIARRAAAFEMKVLYFQRSRLDPAEEARLQVTYRPLLALLGDSDWVVPQLPLNESTENLLDRKRLAGIKPGACIVNVSRAELMEREAVLDALRSGRLGGLALDSQYEEPGRADDELLSFKNVVLTPHMAGSPRTNGLDDIQEMIETLARVLAP